VRRSCVQWPGVRADLVVGEYVFIGAQAAADGTLSAARVQAQGRGQAAGVRASFRRRPGSKVGAADWAPAYAGATTLS
jgi:hypothetical protein